MGIILRLTVATNYAGAAFCRKPDTVALLLKLGADLSQEWGKLLTVNAGVASVA